MRKQKYKIEVFIIHKNKMFKMEELSFTTESFEEYIDEKSQLMRFAEYYKEEFVFGIAPLRGDFWNESYLYFSSSIAGNFRLTKEFIIDLYEDYVYEGE